MTLTHVVGDLLNTTVQNIAQGCNTRGVMGGGISGPIAERWPVVQQQYQRQCMSREFVLGSAQPVTVSPTHMVWNLGTQREPGADGSLWGVMLSFGHMFEQLAAWGMDQVAIPRIGAGIAKLKWADVEATILQVQKYVGAKAPDVFVYTLGSEVNKKW